MSAKYWVAKYVEDPFRNEPRNVGVIVSGADGWAARFAGERDDGALDGRKLQSFKYADVYKQWLQFWRDQLDAENVEEIVRSATPNYYVQFAGEVSDTGTDSVKSVCNFLYGLLVSDTPVMEAFELAMENETERDLAVDVGMTFKEWDILADQSSLMVRHPIKRTQQVRGVHAMHEPTFSQRNGKLYLFEPIDFNAQKPKLIKERAGFMAYMFTDIRQFERAENVEAYSIIRPKFSDLGGAVEYARTILEGESKILNWSDPQQRDHFLRERRAIAGSLAGPIKLSIGQSGPTGPAGPPAISG